LTCGSASTPLSIKDLIPHTSRSPLSLDLRQRLDAVQEARPAGDQHERDGFAGGGEDAHEVDLT